jgi:hypothetical protein
MEAIGHNTERRDHNTVATSQDMCGTVHKEGISYNIEGIIRSVESTGVLISR